MKAAWKLRKYLNPYIFFAILAPSMMILEVVMDLVQPTILQKIIDNGIANGDEKYIISMFVLMILAAFMALIGGVGCSIYATKTAVNFATDIRQDLYETITHFSERNKDHFTLGKLITNLTMDVETLQRAVIMMLKVFVRGPLMFIGAIIFVYITARELFSVLLYVVPLLAISVIVLTQLTGKFFRKVQLAVDVMNTKVQENLAGIRVIKAFNRKNHQVKQFLEVNGLLTKRNITAEQVVAVLMPLTALIVNMGLVYALWIGAIKVDNNTMDVGVILAFINYLMMIMNGLMSSSNVLIQIARAIPSAERIVTVLEEPNEILNPDNSIKTSIRGEVQFIDVSFSYTKQGEPVLKNISFHAKAGETIGIIGMTGSGKSTIMKLLPRIFDVDAGEILVDNQSIKHIDLRNLRQSIGYAPQKAALFSMSIEENLKYGKSDASLNEIIEALEASCAAEFVEKLPDKEQHVLTQGATNLSGGQKQRLAMARAFVRKPSILILDDTTSAVDAISEKKIQQAIATNFPNSTKFIISSKVSSIKDADQILVIDDGYLIASGTHQQLLKTSEHYKEMVETQMEKGGVLNE
ncbi:ABC transporter ATP-binding protein [Lysinibacillus endophyticus]|uniref:ABC transporter ATP-binding protein n=1 Tax=Ureibacillus endophyticus TaxID=1978490 RepID=UPI00209EC48D|nr:ABC transporter ATP-binding protein [Lysinibacillus endophyticus]MCP1146427.1 ABC transporter ATP-binding protein/permease [Lysinibacillus endophyticus]